MPKIYNDGMLRKKAERPGGEKNMAKRTKDVTIEIQQMLGVKQDYGTDVNKWLKAIIVSFRKDVDPNECIVANDNFGKRRKYPDFTEGRKAAGLHPLQMVYNGPTAEAQRDTKFIGKDDKIHSFREVVPGKYITYKTSSGRLIEREWWPEEKMEWFKKSALVIHDEIIKIEE